MNTVKKRKLETYIEEAFEGKYEIILSTNARKEWASEGFSKDQIVDAINNCEVVSGKLECRFVTIKGHIDALQIHMVLRIRKDSKQVIVEKITIGC